MIKVILIFTINCTLISNAFACGGGGGGGTPGMCQISHFSKSNFDQFGQPKVIKTNLHQGEKVDFLYETMNGQIVFEKNGVIFKEFPEDLSKDTLDAIEKSLLKLHSI